MTSTVPTVRRRSRPNPRLLIGLFLFLVSVAGVSYLLSTADATVTAYAAPADIRTGDIVDPSRLTVVRVRVDDVDAHYLTPRSAGSPAVASRYLSPGELIPLSALGGEGLEGMSSVVVQPAVPIAATVRAGTRVELWATPGGGSTPRMLAASVEVRDVQSTQSFLDVTSGVRVELLVPDAAVSPVLAAIAAKDAIALVARPGVP